MCGRYFVSDEMKKHMETFTGFRYKTDPEKQTGDVYPSEVSPIIHGNQGKLQVSGMRWGFGISETKKLVINARAEMCLDKPMFSQSVLTRRCIIMAAGFYEWDQKHNKSRFTCENTPYLYMAGFYRPYEDGNHYVILTTEANESMRPVHDRMPLILPENRLEEWIMDDSCTKGILKEKPELLYREQDYEQLTLF